MTSPAEYDEASAHAFSRKWQIAVGVFVALTALLTAGYTIVETFWG